jgi:nitroimidazol reductase NimA-like FMN-containing flavoprotein (pyridoxamine 5'-phosphate oxidase superfamily)
MAGTVVQELEARECWSLLAAAEVGRLALSVDGSPEIFPVNHAVDGQRVLVRTAAGTKLFAAVGRDVALEVDGVDDGTAWSVVAKGVGAEVLDPAGLQRAEELLDPWLESEKRHVLEIVVEVVTGRRFPIRRRG